MTWVWSDFTGGETQDALCDGWRTGNSPMATAYGGMALISTPVATGVGAIQIPAAVTNATAAFNTGPGSDRIMYLQAKVNCDGTLSNAIGLFAPLLPGGHAGAFILEVGTDLRVRVCALGAAGSWANRIPLTPWSVDTVGNGSYKHLAWFVDALTLGTHHMWTTVMIDGVAQIMADLGEYVAAPGTYLAQSYGVAPGVNVRLDDVCAAHSLSASDAPHLAAVPIAKVFAQHPVSDTGAALNFTRSSGAGTWESHWDEETGNNGDTDYLYTAASAKTQNSLMEDADAVGMAAGAVLLMGPVPTLVHRIVSGSKFNGFATATGANNFGLGSPGSTYEGAVGVFVKAAGTWARADLTAMFVGVGTGATGHDKDWRVTTMMNQLLSSEANLPLAPAPMIQQTCVF